MEIIAGLLSCAVVEGEWTRRTVWIQTILMERRWNGDRTETWHIVWIGPNSFVLRYVRQKLQVYPTFRHHKVAQTVHTYALYLGGVRFKISIKSKAIFRAFVVSLPTIADIITSHFSQGLLSNVPREKRKSANNWLPSPTNSVSEFLVFFLGAFAKLRKATTSFVKSVCPPASPHVITRLPLDRFSLNLTFEDSSKICQENSSFIKIGQE